MGDGNGKSNIQRMEAGNPPLIDGKPVELHHIDQRMDSPLAELTSDEHRGFGNDSVLHDKSQPSQIDRAAFEKEKDAYWKERAAQVRAWGG